MQKCLYRGLCPKLSTNRKVMWWKIILGVIGLAVVGFIGMVIKMAITEAKEETRDIERASKSEN